MTMARNKFAFLTAGLVLAILTLTNCGEVACDPTRDSWCEENDSSSSIGGGSSSSSGGLPLSSNGGNSSSSVGGGSSSSGGGLPLSSNGGNSSSSVGGGSSSSGGGGNVVHGEPVNYGGETYPTVVIGTQTWFAKNLNYNVEGSKCYDNDPANCTKYGRLYDWSTAMGFSSNCNSSTCSGQIQPKHRGICPTGWHIPSHADWDALMTAVGGENTAGTKLKAPSGWSNGGDGTDNYGFSALPGGHGNSDGSFRYVGIAGGWWSASELNSDVAYDRRMGYDRSYVDRGNSYKSALFSVRCLQD